MRPRERDYRYGQVIFVADGVWLRVDRGGAEKVKVSVCAPPEVPVVRAETWAGAPRGVPVVRAEKTEGVRRG